MRQQTGLTLDEVYELSLKALNACGASEASARSLARATTAAEAEGLPNVGLSHLLDYLGSLQRGQINGQAEPILKRNGPSSLLVEGDAGIAHLAFDIAFNALTDAASASGIAALAVRNVFTCGVVGYFVERIAQEGLVGQAYANAPAMVAPWSGAALPFFGTNPIAFGVPIAGRSPLVIDQSTTITAFVNIRDAARNKQPIPPEWAFDTAGCPTSNAEEALKGTVAPSGGYKGTNLALMVDVLAAGLSGANWSYQAPEFGVGNEPVNIGQFFVAIDPVFFCGNDFAQRMAEFVAVYEKEFNGHVPGDSRQKHRHQAEQNGVVVDAEVLEKIHAYIKTN